MRGADLVTRDPGTKSIIGQETERGCNGGLGSDDDVGGGRVADCVAAITRTPTPWHAETGQGV
jgi:hypothetical protein